MHYTTIDPLKCQIFEPTTMHYTTIDSPKDKNSNLRPCTTQPLMTPEKTNIRHACITIDSPKVKDSNQRPCATPALTPKMSNIQTHDHALHHHWPKKNQIRTLDHALHHHWHPKSQRFEHTTIDPNVKEPNPWTCTTPPLTPNVKIRTHDIHCTTIDPHNVKSPKRQRFESKTMHYTPLLTTSTDTSTASIHMVIDDVAAHNPNHLCIGMMKKYAMVIDDITAHVRTCMMRQWWKRLNNSSKLPNFHLSTELSL
jgi:hypothetical protein